MWFTNLDVGGKIAVIAAMFIGAATLVGFVLHWIRLWKLRRKK